MFTMQLAGLGSMVVIGDSQVIQDIFSQDGSFDSGVGNALAEPLLGRKSIILLDGERHRRERKLLMPPLHGERLKTHAQRISQITQELTSKWQEGVPFVARIEMQKISLEVIVQVIFGLKEGERYQQLKLLLTDWLNMTDSPLRSSMLFFPWLQREWTPWGRMKRLQQAIHALLQAEINERKDQLDQQQTDMLSLMMAARDENGQPMTDEELRDELLTMLFAGHETTATILGWALYEIHRQPEVLQSLLDELDCSEINSSFMEIARLPNLTAVCQETMRKYPVLPGIFPRIPKSRVTLGGHTFDAGTMLLPSMYLVHYREDIYPDPQTFRPSRFLDRQYSPCEYLPFGGGSRRCLGYALAELEMKLVLATIVSGYQLVLMESKPVTPQRRGFTLAPKGGIRMAMTARRNK